jgi:hypothetical protein
MRKYVFYLSLLLFVASCGKDKAPDLPTGSGVYIVNEGNFNFGTAEISFYNTSSNQVTNGLFNAANNYMLGDVAQSMYIKDSTGFIVVNNSAKIEVVRLPSLQRVRTISIPNSSPRNFLPVNDSVALVTELYARKVWVINYKTGALINSITTQGWTENLFVIGNDVFAEQKINKTLSNTFATIYKINVAANTAAHSTTFNGRDIGGMVKDKYNHIWVAVDEDTVQHLKAGFYCFNTDFTEVKSFTFSGSGHHPSRLSINPAGDRLYYSDGSVFTFSVEDNEVPSSVFIDKAGRNIYSIAVNPVNGDIYLSDALDFVQQSVIYRYDKNGNLLHTFTAGIISGNFAFYE